MSEQKKREGDHRDRPSVSRLIYSSVMQVKAVLNTDSSCTCFHNVSMKKSLTN